MRRWWCQSVYVALIFCLFSSSSFLPFVLSPPVIFYIIFILLPAFIHLNAPRNDQKTPQKTLSSKKRPPLSGSGWFFLFQLIVLRFLFPLHHFHSSSNVKNKPQNENSFFNKYVRIIAFSRLKRRVKKDFHCIHS